MLNTGAPQGCVLSPVLFVLYTNDLQSTNDNVKIIKYADDTAVIGLISNNDSCDYLQSVSNVNNWCEDNYLNLNVSKTKEVIWDFRRKRTDTEPVVIDDKNVEVVDSYKYLGCVIDNKLKFDSHVHSQIRKANKKLYFVRLMNNLKVNEEIIAKFYNTAISPVMTYGLLAFYALLSKKLQYELDRPRRICMRLLNTNIIDTIVNVNTVYENSLCKFVTHILSNNAHPLFKELIYLPHGQRLRACFCRTSRYRNTIIPVSVLHYNMHRCTSH